MPVDPALPQVFTPLTSPGLSPTTYQNLVADTLGEVGDSTDGTDQIIANLEANSAAFAQEMPGAQADADNIPDTVAAFDTSAIDAVAGNPAAAAAMVNEYAAILGATADGMGDLPPLPLFVAAAGGPGAGPYSVNVDMGTSIAGSPPTTFFFGLPLPADQLARIATVALLGGEPVLTGATFQYIPLYANIPEPEVVIAINPVQAGTFTAFVEVVDSGGIILATANLTITVLPVDQVAQSEAVSGGAQQ